MSVLEQDTAYHEKSRGELLQESERLASEAAEIQKLRSRLQELEVRMGSATSGLAETRSAHEHKVETLRGALRMIWQASQGKQLEDLRTVSGRVYKSAKLLVIEHDGVRIEHQEGTARVPRQEIPSPLKEMLGFDFDLALYFKDEEQVPDPTNGNSDDVASAAEPAVPVRPPDSAESERRILEHTQELDRVARLRAQADRFDQEAERYDSEAREHRQKAGMARAAGRSSMQDAEATKDTQTASGLRNRSAALRAEANKLEAELRAVP